VSEWQTNLTDDSALITYQVKLFWVLALYGEGM